MKYTYQNSLVAKYGKNTVLLPDQILEKLPEHSNKPFPALCENGAQIRVVLRADLSCFSKKLYVVTAEQRVKK